MNENQVRRRNFWSLLFEGTFFLSGMAFLDANSVVPVFIDTFTGSLQLAGLAVALKAASSILSQLIVGPRVSNIKNMPAFITRVMFVCRPLPLVMIPILFSGVSNHLKAVLFLVVFSLLWLSDGVILVPWLDLFGRTIPEKRRGKLFGYQQILGGIGSLAAGFIIKLSLENAQLTSAGRYSIIFGMGGLTLLIASIAMLFAKDLPRKVEVEKVYLSDYYRKLPSYFKKNTLYRKLILVRILSSFTAMIFPFVILFAKHRFHLNPSQVSNLIYIQILGSLVGGLIWGEISHRFGNRKVIAISQVLTLLLSLLAFFSLSLGVTTFPVILIWSMCLLTGISMGSWMGFINYTIEIVDDEERPVYFVLTSIITFPFVFVPYFAGLIADFWGFIPLFAIVGVFGMINAALSMGLKPSEG